MKAIETRYMGYRFRSRLEARWAVFFQTLEIEWEYEPEGFVLFSGPYLPDFWLPGLHAYAEVKPFDAAFNWKVAEELAEFSACEVIALVGSPDTKWYELIHPSGLLDLGNGEKEFYPASRDWIDFESSGFDYRQWIWGVPDSPPVLDVGQRFKRSVAAARGARFEHGERP